MSEKKTINPTRLKKAMGFSGLNQKQLAEKTGVSRGYVNSLLNQKNCGKKQQINTIKLLADALGTSINFLTGDSKYLNSEEEQKAYARKQRFENRTQKKNKQETLDSLKLFLKIYDIKLTFDDNMKTFTIVDADNKEIEKNADIELLNGLVNMFINLYQVGMDIISCYFDDGIYLKQLSY